MTARHNYSPYTIDWFFTSSGLAAKHISHPGLLMTFSDVQNVHTQISCTTKTKRLSESSRRSWKYTLIHKNILNSCNNWCSSTRTGKDINLPSLLVFFKTSPLSIIPVAALSNIPPIQPNILYNYYFMIDF